MSFMIRKTLDFNSPLPLYYQLKDIFIEKIANSEWLSGEMIPPEPDLIDMFKVSRTTVRQAVHALVNEGRLVKRRGKGTFVISPRIESELGQLLGFTERMLLEGFKPG